MNSLPVTFDHVFREYRQRGGNVVMGLSDVSFHVAAGEFVCVVGRSGHGKTTMLRVLAGLEPPTGGRVMVGDRQVQGPGRDRAMAFQQDTVLPWLKVRDNVELGLRAQGIGARERHALADKYLAAVGLQPQYAESWPKELSGGMRKRVALAAILAVESPIWLMDEPFGFLDYFTRRDLQSQLLELWSASRRTVFFVTHDIEEALTLGDRILLVRHGHLVSNLEVALPRPRGEDVRASADGLALVKAILGDLYGAEAPPADEALVNRAPAADKEM